MANIDFSKIKKQTISSYELIGDKVLFKTANFEFLVPVENVKQVKEFVDYPVLIDENVFNFDGYQIVDKFTQESLRIRDFKAFVYFPKIDYSIGNINVLRDEGVYRIMDNDKYTYKDLLTEKVDPRNIFSNLVIYISKLDEIDLPTLEIGCKNIVIKSYEKATFKPSNILSTLTVRLDKNGFVFHDNFRSRLYHLVKGKLF